MELEEKIAVALHPPRCPKCGALIDHLKMFCMEEGRYLVSYNEEHDGLDVYYDTQIEGSELYREYECPECSVVIFSNRAGSTAPGIEGVESFFRPQVPEELKGEE